ncbi:MAG: hypothetical protein KGL35_01005 [Bradyrhizobium sp.]|nr:hypothetical protein [Bradyrhizobium sp.]
MSNETVFPDGLIAKPPHAKAPSFVKGALSIKREALIAWLQSRDDEWVNLDIKESRNGEDDMPTAYTEWQAIPVDDQRALWLATSKGGCFTTDERKAIKEYKPTTAEKAS